MTTTDTQAKPGRSTSTAPQDATAPLDSYGGNEDIGIGPGPRLGGPRGRHRRPRPRKTLLAAGGLALAAGVLSLVRMAPESGVGGLGTAEAEPRPDGPGTTAGSDRATPDATTVGEVGAAPEVSPSATSVLGGASAPRLPRVSLGPTSSTTGTPPTPGSDTTTAANAPNPPGAPSPTAASRPPAPTAPHPAPTPPPSRTSDAPPPPPPQQPQQTPRPGLCVPVIGLCVDSLNR